MHLAEDEVQRLLDAELAAAMPASAKEHLATCAECRSRVREAEADEAWVADRLRLLDHEPVKLHLDEVLATPRAAGPRRIAAGILLVAALGGVAYAAPGSPLPRLLSRVVQLIAPPDQPPSRSPGTVQSSGARAGIAVDPGERFTVELIPGTVSGTVVITLTEGSEIVVRARGGTSTFSSEVDRLLVRQAGDSASVEIDVPRAAPSVELRLGTRSIWRKAGSRITSDVPADPQGHDRWSLPPGR